MTTFCPYCNAEIEEEAHREWMKSSPDYLDSFEFECPECHREMEIDVGLQPDFTVFGRQS